MPLQSLKTVTLNKYQASERGVCGGLENLCKTSKPSGGTREVGRKGDRKGKGQVWRVSFPGGSLSGSGGGQAGNRKHFDPAVGRYLWMWLHYSCGGERNYLIRKPSEVTGLRRPGKEVILAAVRSTTTPPNHLQLALFKDTNLCCLLDRTHRQMKWMKELSHCRYDRLQPWATG